MHTFPYRSRPSTPARPRTASRRAWRGGRRGATLKRGVAPALVAMFVALAAAASSALAADRALVLSTDYQTAYYSRLDLAAPWAQATAIGPVCPDAAVRVHGDRAYVLGRYGCDHVQVIDLGAGLQTLLQFSTGNGTNPQDIEILTPTKAYISLYERDYILIVNPQTGQELGRISLAGFSDDDGLPETAEMAKVGDRVFVCLQRLDRQHGFTAANPSFIAVVDGNTNALVDADPETAGLQAIVLSGRNPFSELVLDPVRQKLYVSEEGNFGVLDGGAEFVDPVTLRAEGFFVTEAALGGDIISLRLWVDCAGYAIVEDSSARTKLVRFDRCVGGAPALCWQSAGFDLCDVEIDRQGLVLLSDRDLLLPGVRLFRAPGTTQITTSPIGFGLPPCDLAPLTAMTPTEAPPAVSTAGLRLQVAGPNPFNPTTALHVETLPGTPARLEVLDVRGRRLRLLWEGTAASPGRDLVWDGRDDAGAALPSGVYVALLSAGGATRNARLVFVR